MDIETEDGVGYEAASYKMQETEVLSSPGNGKWIVYPRGADYVTIILNSTGDARIEVTNADRSLIDADTVPTEQLIAWPHGNIGVDKKECSLKPVNAFRQVNISGTSTLTALGGN